MLFVVAAVVALFCFLGGVFLKDIAARQIMAGIFIAIFLFGLLAAFTMWRSLTLSQAASREADPLLSALLVGASGALPLLGALSGAWVRSYMRPKESE